MIGFVHLPSPAPSPRRGAPTLDAQNLLWFSIEIRLPSGNFEPFLNDLSNEATHTNHRRVNSNDVTAEYVDLQSRLKTKKEVR
ncbi:MAG TPA: DUF4349 domain-containing protein [Bacteroidetes bacterium]|nr:DUF4349 domain-containing protein [Bacteroidota bacterium]